MKRAGRARRRVLAALCPQGGVIVDVGADHGHVAHTVGGIATELAPHRIHRRDLRWVVADGLRPFRRVDTAIIAGMGARTIARILDAGPAPRVAVLHAQDDPPALRRWLASHGWRIDVEALAPEAGRFAEVIRAVPGQETSQGLELAFGPRLLQHGHPLLVAHLRQLRGYYARLAEATAPHDPDRHHHAERCTRFLHDRIVEHEARSRLCL